MNAEEAQKLIKAGETHTVEFKESLSLRDEIGEGISALSNTSGGVIFVGVTDNGEVLGVQIGKKTIEDLANFIKINTDNHAFPKISVADIEGKSVIIIEIKESDEKPVFFRGKAYARIGKSRHQLSASEIRKLAKESGPKIHWDEQPCEGASLSDIDKEKIRLFKERYKEANKTELQGSGEDILKGLGCMKIVGGYAVPTNAGILLFGKEPQKFFPQSAIRIAIYPGTTVGTEHIDIKEFEGDLFSQVDDAEKYILRYVYSPSVMKTGRIEREEVPQYPYFALRELIVNAVVHRDYSITGSKAIIKIFSDRIEYQSPGALPRGITPKNIVKEQFLRNHAIGKVFSKIKYIEEMGEGWDRIMEEVKNHPLKPPMPKIEDTGASVIITLFSAKLPAPIEETAVNEWLTKVNARLAEELSDKDKEIISFAIKNAKITSADCQKLLGVSRVMANKYFGRLIKKKVLVKKGSGKFTYYVLAKIK